MAQTTRNRSAAVCGIIFTTMFFSSTAHGQLNDAQRAEIAKRRAAAKEAKAGARPPDMSVAPPAPVQTPAPQIIANVPPQECTPEMAGCVPTRPVTTPPPVAAKPKPRPRPVPVLPPLCEGDAYLEGKVCRCPQVKFPDGTYHAGILVQVPGSRIQKCAVNQEHVKHLTSEITRREFDDLRERVRVLEQVKRALCANGKDPCTELENLQRQIDELKGKLAAGPAPAASNPNQVVTLNIDFDKILEQLGDHENRLTIVEQYWCPPIPGEPAAKTDARCKALQDRLRQLYAAIIEAIEELQRNQGKPIDPALRDRLNRLFDQDGRPLADDLDPSRRRPAPSATGGQPPQPTAAQPAKPRPIEFVAAAVYYVSVFDGAVDSQGGALTLQIQGRQRVTGYGRALTGIGNNDGWAFHIAPGAGLRVNLAWWFGMQFGGTCVVDTRAGYYRRPKVAVPSWGCGGEAGFDIWFTRLVGLVVDLNFLYGERAVRLNQFNWPVVERRFRFEGNAGLAFRW